MIKDKIREDYDMSFSTCNQIGYFLYRHIRLDKNEPFYIGIGTIRKDSNTDWQYDRSLDFKRRNKIWKIIFKKNKKILVEIIYESDSKEVIFEKEKEFIKLYGRIDLKTGILANMTDGGLNDKDHLAKGTEITKRGICIYNIKGDRISCFDSCKDGASYLSNILKKRIGKASVNEVLKCQNRLIFGYYIRDKTEFNKIDVNPSIRQKMRYGKVEIIDIDGNAKIYNNLDEFCFEEKIQRKYILSFIKGHSKFIVGSNKIFKFNWL